MARAGLNSVNRQLSKMLKKNFRLVIVILCALIGLFFIYRRSIIRRDGFQDKNSKDWCPFRDENGKLLPRVKFYNNNRFCSATEGLGKDRKCSELEVNYKEAQDICANKNGRLCFVEEIEAKKTERTGCYHDIKQIWTYYGSTIRGNGKGGVTSFPSSPPPQSSKAHVRCCASVLPPGFHCAEKPPGFYSAEKPPGPGVTPPGGFKVIPLVDRGEPAHYYVQIYNIMQDPPKEQPIINYFEQWDPTRNNDGRRVIKYKLYGKDKNLYVKDFYDNLQKYQIVIKNTSYNDNIAIEIDGMNQSLSIDVANLLQYDQLGIFKPEIGNIDSPYNTNIKIEKFNINTKVNPFALRGRTSASLLELSSLYSRRAILLGALDNFKQGKKLRTSRIIEAINCTVDDTLVDFKYQEGKYYP